MDKCDECKERRHSKCLAFSDHPGLTEEQKWCECGVEVGDIGVPYDVPMSNVFDLPTQNGHQ